MRYVKEPNRVQDLCSSQYSLTHIMWWGIRNLINSRKYFSHVADNKWYFHLLECMMLAWGMDFPSPALGTKAPAASIGCFFALPCSAVDCSSKLILDIRAINGTHPNHSGCKSTAILDFSQECSLATFHLQYRHRPKVSQVNNFGTDLLWYLLLMVGLCCWFSTSTAVENWGRQKCQVMPFILYKGGI